MSSCSLYFAVAVTVLLVHLYYIYKSFATDDTASSTNIHRFINSISIESTTINIALIMNKQTAAETSPTAAVATRPSSSMSKDANHRSMWCARRWG